MAVKKSIEVIIESHAGRKRASVPADSVGWSALVGTVGSGVLAKLIISGVIPVTPVVCHEGNGRNGYLLIDIDL